MQKKGPEQKSDHHHPVLHIPNSLCIKFQPKLNIFEFLDQINPTKVFPILKGKKGESPSNYNIRIRLGSKFQLEQTIVDFF